MAAPRGTILPPAREPHPGTTGRGGFLRQANLEICAAAGNVSRRRARRLADVSDGAVELARRETGFAQGDSRGTAGTSVRLRYSFHQAPSIACRQRVLSIAV